MNVSAKSLDSRVVIKSHPFSRFPFVNANVGINACNIGKSVTEVR